MKSQKLHFRISQQNPQVPSSSRALPVSANQHVKLCYRRAACAMTVHGSLLFSASAHNERKQSATSPPLFNRPVSATFHKSYCCLCSHSLLSQL